MSEAAENLRAWHLLTECRQSGALVLAIPGRAGWKLRIYQADRLAPLQLANLTAQRAACARVLDKLSA